MEHRRPVSGEIMTAGSARPGRDRADVVDAEFETVESSERPGNLRDAFLAPHEPVPPLGLGSLLGSPEAVSTSRRGQPGGPLFWSAGLGTVALAFWVSGGHALFDLAPNGTAAAGLRIADLGSRVETTTERSVLMVDGEAVNDGATARHLPPLAIDVTASDGSRTRYRLGTSGRSLAQGERFAFSGRFEVPKDGVKAISVTFVE